MFNVFYTVKIVRNVLLLTFREATLRRTFLMFDKDKNGQIDVHELDLVCNIYIKTS